MTLRLVTSVPIRFPAGLAARGKASRFTEEMNPPKNLSFTRQFYLDFADHDDYLSDHGSQRRA